MIAKGCVYHIVRVKDVESKFSSFELVLVVMEFLRVFLNYFPESLPNGR